MLCTGAPPSDHRSNTQIFPLARCCVGAVSLRLMLTTLPTDSGVVCGWSSSSSSRPGGFVWIVIVEVRGWMSRYDVWDRPTESVTVRYIRYQTLIEVSPVVGMVNVLDVKPLVAAINEWVCVLWCRSIHQVNALAGSVPSSWSVAVPVYVKTSPALYIVTYGGEVMVYEGVWVLVVYGVATF